MWLHASSHLTKIGSNVLQHHQCTAREQAVRIHIMMNKEGQVLWTPFHTAGKEESYILGQAQHYRSGMCTLAEVFCKEFKSVSLSLALSHNQSYAQMHCSPHSFVIRSFTGVIFLRKSSFRNRVKHRADCQGRKLGYFGPIVGREVLWTTLL